MISVLSGIDKMQAFHGSWLQKLTLFRSMRPIGSDVHLYLVLFFLPRHRRSHANEFFSSSEETCTMRRSRLSPVLMEVPQIKSL